MNERARPVLLYDGYCAFCNWAVRVVLGADREGRFRFAPLHGDFAARVAQRHPSLQEIDSLVLVEPMVGGAEGALTGTGMPGGPAHGASGEDMAVEHVHVRSDAVLRSARLLGGPWSLLGILRVVPRPIRDWAYDFVARWRYRLFGRYETCPMPPLEVRDRFLE